MASNIRSHLERPVVDELKELRDIAQREHGAHARSTLRLEEALRAEQRELRRNRGDRKPSSGPGRG